MYLWPASWRQREMFPLMFGPLPLLLVVLLSLALAALHVAAVLATEPRYPCAFIDTVNISGAYALNASTNTYLPVQQQPQYGPPHYPAELVAIYDFVIENGQRLSAESHLRACGCKQKPCIRFCCAQGYYYDVVNRTCSSIAALGMEVDTDGTPTTDSPLFFSLDQRSMQVVHANGTLHAVNTSAHFAVHIGTPCIKMRVVPKDGRIVHWSLYENGTIAHKNHLFSKHYCYTPLQRSSSVWEWQPLACAPEKLPFVLGVREWTYAISLIITVVCMVIVLFIYLFCTELRNTFYGVAIKAYTLCIIIGYSLLAHLTLTDPGRMSKFACTHIPCLVVLYLVLSFCILSFISFNFYLNFHGIILSKLMFWLIFFPFVFMAVGWYFFVAYDNYGGKAVFSVDICWFDPRNWSIMLYFYTPIFVACTICGLFYILTLIRRNERRESDVNKLSARIEENRLKSFWKFFGYTFAAWFVCMSSFAFNYYRGEHTHINYAVCLFIAFHGFGAIYALLGKNQQIQNFLRKIENDIDDNDEDDEDEEDGDANGECFGNEEVRVHSMPMAIF